MTPFFYTWYYKVTKLYQVFVKYRDRSNCKSIRELFLHIRITNYFMRYTDNLVGSVRWFIGWVLRWLVHFRTTGEWCPPLGIGSLFDWSEYEGTSYPTWREVGVFSYWFYLPSRCVWRRRIRWLRTCT